MLAVDMRNKGQKRSFLQQAVNAIPNNQARKKRIMNAALHDSYNNPSLPKEAYAMYRMEACYYQMSGRNIPEFLSKEMVSHLVKCEAITSEKAKYACASAIAKNYSK